MADFRRLADYEDDDIAAALAALREEWQTRGFRLVEVADGWQFISGDGYMEYLRRLRPQKTARLSRQLMEVLAIIAYRQPTTRGDIEQIRGVSVSSVQLAALEELGWIEEVGRRETPGRPVLFGTTKTFLNDLALSSLDELPELAQEEINAEFEENDAAAADSKNGADAGQLAVGLSTAQTPHDDSVDNGDNGDNADNNSPTDSADNSANNGDNNSPADSADDSADNGNDNSAADSADNSVNNGGDNSVADSADDSVNNGNDNSPADSADNSANNGDNNSPADSADDSVNNGGDDSPADSADNSANNGNDNSPADSVDNSANNGDDSTGDGGRL